MKMILITLVMFCLNANEIKLQQYSFHQFGIGEKTAKEKIYKAKQEENQHEMIEATTWPPPESVLPAAVLFSMLSIFMLVVAGIIGIALVTIVVMIVIKLIKKLKWFE